MNNPPNPISVGEILKTDYGQTSYLVDGLLPSPGLTVLAGFPSQGKTWITLEIAKSVARGMPAFNHFPTKQGGVLIVDEEIALKHIKERLQLMGLTENDPIFYLSQQGISIEKDTEQLAAYCTANNIMLVIFDSLVRVLNADENSAQEVARVFKVLQAFTKAGISVFFTHHNRKPSEGRSGNPAHEMRGSSDILAVIDSQLYLTKKKDEKGVLVIEQGKSRYDKELKPFEITITENADGKPSAFEFKGFVEFKPKKAKAEEALDEMTQLLSEKSTMSRPEIHEALIEQHGKSTIDDAIKAGIEDNLIEEVPKTELPEDANAKQKYFRLHSQSAPPATADDAEPLPSQVPIPEGL